MLIQFANSPSEQDLVFDKSLTSDERKLIHAQAQKLGLKSVSQGKGADRFLVVRKKLALSEILEAAGRNGGQIGCYQVVSKGDLPD